jgi:hypothetical protein
VAVLGSVRSELPAQHARGSTIPPPIAPSSQGSAPAQWAAQGSRDQPQRARVNCAISITALVVNAHMGRSAISSMYAQCAGGNTQHPTADRAWPPQWPQDARAARRTGTLPVKRTSIRSNITSD